MASWKLAPRWVLVSLQFPDPRPADVNRGALLAEVLEADVPAPRPVLDGRRVGAVVPLHRPVVITQVGVLDHLAIEHGLEVRALQFDPALVPLGRPVNL